MDTIIYKGQHIDPVYEINSEGEQIIDDLIRYPVDSVVYCSVCDVALNGLSESDQANLFITQEELDGKVLDPDVCSYSYFVVMNKNVVKAVLCNTNKDTSCYSLYFLSPIIYEI